ncbi:MAG: formylglycine-generating enzyme family protein, partial [Planctomycetota bacterium]|nr:formylglycine-generating enzyme family protein [Planctomycetota bacterium]
MSCGSFCCLAIRWSLPVVLIGLIHESSPAQETDNEQIVTRFRNEMIEISPGTAAFKSSFPYGQLGNEAGTVTRAPEPFLIGQYEVPQNLWQAIMNQNPSRWKGPRNSVEMVSVADVIQFCERLTKELRELNLITQQQIVRLPTELEWEYAARAGTDTEYSFGNDVERLDDYGWHTGNAAGNDPPVGAKKPNPWKLYDVHGYLSEYCLPTQATQ